jgi:uncharacterized protein YndB with AHSA1/START domain
MTATSDRIRLAARREQLFAMFTDHSSWPQWFEAHAGWPDGPPAAIAAGARFRQQMTFLGGHDTMSWTVQRLDSPHTLVLDGTGTLHGSCLLGFVLHPAETGTRMAVTVGLSAPIPRPLLKRAERGLLREFEYSMQRLDAYLRAEDPDAIAAPTPTELGVPARLDPLLRLATRLAPHLDTTPILGELARRAHHGHSRNAP